MADTRELVVKLKVENTQLKAEVDKLRDGFKKLSDSAKESGAHGVTAVQAVSANLRAMEGGISNNLRAAERLIASSKTLSSIAQTLFPLAGGIAMIGIFDKLVEHIGKVKEAFDEIAAAPAKFQSAMVGANSSVEEQHTKLIKTSDQLQNQLAMLQHRPVNMIRVALDDIAEAVSTMDKQFASAFKNIQTNAINTKMVLDGMAYVIASMSGKSTGAGPNNALTTIQDQLAEKHLAFQESFNSATTDTGKREAINKGLDDVTGFLRQVIAKRQADIDAKSAADAGHDVVDYQTGVHRVGARSAAESQAANASDIALDKQIIRAAKEELVQASMEAKNGLATLQIAGITQSRTNARTAADDPLARLLERLDQQNALGGAEGSKDPRLIAEAKTAEEVAQINKQLVESGRAKLSEEQQDIIFARELRNAQREALQRSAAESVRQTEEEGRHKVAAARKQLEENMRAIELQVKAEESQAKKTEELGKSYDEMLAKIQAQTAAYADEHKHMSEHARQLIEDKKALAEFEIELRAKGFSEDQIKALKAAKQGELSAKGAATHDPISLTQGIQDGLSSISAQVNNVGGQVSSVLGGAFKGVEDNLASMITTGKANWSSFFQTLSADLAKLAMNMMLKQLLKGLGGGDGSDDSSGGGGGILSSIAGVFGGGHADGGSVSAGTTYLVGERGPELFTAGATGFITPNHALGNSGGGNHFHFNIDAKGAHNSAEVELAVQRGIQKHRQQFVADAMMMQHEARMRSVRGRG